MCSFQMMPLETIDDRRLRQRAFYYTRIYADPHEKDTVYILNTALYRSTDAGKTIRSIRVPHGDNHDLWIAANDPKRMINSNDGGANVSTNGGESWTARTSRRRSTTWSRPRTFVAVYQRTSRTTTRRDDGNGAYRRRWRRKRLRRAGPCRHRRLLCRATVGLTRINRRTGEVRAINVWPDNPMGFSSGDITERFQWTYPIVIAPTDPNTLYATSQHVWEVHK